METLRDLRRQTDDALVEFTVIKTQLREKLKITDDLKAKIADKNQAYRSMTVGVSYGFMKAHEMEIVMIEIDRKKLEAQLSQYEKEVGEMNTWYLLVEKGLAEARQKEDEFLRTLVV